ncbi:hypothetical protein L3Q65_21520 [Amycolatopsis sp. FU40]|uniref:putative T7SS-secreted protein n=1 Tax=Amycolatopsis sp. FU40 TaxID=2914159 RepID=UPI001F1EF2C1|nr:hypothetical protein [Amycolatopsis sp. FU40]UKD59192.1 hypothetical protein L3Q65_21520 [Amycolatopsis sp. FU40]
MNRDRIADAAAPVQTGSYPALGFDPAPGVVATVSEVAATLGKVGAEMGRAYEDLTKLGKSDSFWEGDGAQAFQKTVGEVPDYLDKAHRSLSGASGTLTNWADDLRTMQSHAADLERQAAAAQSQVASARSNPDLGLAGQSFPDPAQFQQAQEALGHAQQRLDQAQQGLDAIREDAKRLQAQHLDLAGQVAAALRKAKDEAPEEPGLLDKIGDAIGKIADGIKNLAGKVWNWVKEHADVIAKIGDVLSTIGTVLSTIAPFTAAIPIVGEVVAAAAIGFSAGAMAAHGLAKAAGANVSWSSIAFDAVGMIPGGGTAKGAIGAAKVGPKVVKGAIGAAKEAKGVVQAVAKGAGAARNILHDEGLVQTAFGWGASFDKWVGGPILKMEHSAGAAGAAAWGAATKAGGMAAKWVAEPYLERAEDSAKDFVKDTVTGRPTQSAGQIFDRVVKGR